MAAGGAPVTDAHVDRAWRRLRKRHWPATLAEVLEHPLWGRCVRGLAQSLANGERAAGPQMQAPARAKPPAVPARPAPPLFDRKRAAAGERDDDLFPETHHP
jgi:hypothetical protein